LMKKIYYAILILSFMLMAMKSDMEAYRIYDQNGKNSSYGKLLKQALDSDIILFGEIHTNPINHWLQFELTSDLYKEFGDKLILGAEMFERDQQVIVNEFVDSLISESNFKSQARLWPNYKTDYKPLVDFARNNKLPFIATNIPRRYASMVFSDGFEALDKLPDATLNYIAPLPIPYDPELPGYKSMLELGEEMNSHSSENLPMAQAVKDATMAHSILEYLETGKVFLHYHGSYHSENFEGIMWYLNLYRPGLKIMTIASAEQDATDKLEEDNEGLADFIIVTPKTMTKTH
ncbi:MAG TPA: ChaN family lipoprotein, partial [Bacteroidales bacterium]|nr:ChaN family lipoprotein [Bacteroidales bacterium]